MKKQLASIREWLALAETAEQHDKPRSLAAALAEVAVRAQRAAEHAERLIAARDTEGKEAA